MSTRIRKPTKAAAARAPALNLRKQASQERSRATVDALIEATARVLVREGFERASTNRIAAEAGVSIGSLYQYFPTKESLVASVIERHKSEMLGILRDALARVAQRPVGEAMREIVDVMIRAHRVDPQLHRVLVEQIPRTGRLAEVEGFEREANELVRAFLEAHRSELRRALDLELATFVCVSTVETLAHGAVLHQPQLLADDRVESFIDEVTRLVLQYLT
ncbi:TetR/AcrR family transcriptional regulator [Variovorax sp. NFACC27]|uniref:TetR/AcrR family transcriptional regulator n=1 Tax=Variovorax gossypii TaxID=1679495 RepID=A0A3S0J4H8_9BURK|nr:MULTISPECIES: TetR/AcrR family transcriptional regulator [Variovorax]MDP9606197.1 AcrR family transcriptional regulator [Variovorax paradoxus]SEF35325.1 transcriptional regulator, TetR family [Variovorax sp. NFACC28]SEG99329.1 transcriptional regulator, TetR family [Variovorax sp. NFACC29]SFE21673.1 transcriptional regulator, TetR family [Variovorax sp. NFACC26]SFH26763.1 transcriptional regulator, TetR family [Variovorax sp. NFACC27]